ncbi:Sel1 repeat-containing protein [Dongia mobilis]|uniref:Sel1 repeat-containing protein n=1 Tax=Dongia mobilis TaxID=578943 RepID=A0A4R6WPR6_9PROT|nr:tetratricopeptide repeat protein [Dongia mobilis]TDQ81479.1 Sel1 repeat-containing protein [Dongia mobilis]
MIRITRHFARKASFYGIIGIGLLAMTPVPAAADYQTGVNAYYRGEFLAALEAWRPLAEAGDPVAQNSIGALYDHGLGVPEDNYEAARWYEMAAEGGLPLAMRNLGNQYATGHGKPFDVEMARQWYERAAAKGDRQSVSLLRQLRPSAVSAQSANAAPTFTTPTTTGSLAVPVQGPTEALGATGTGASDSAAAGDLTISGLGSETSPAAAPANPSQEILLDIGGDTVAIGGSGTATAPQPAQPQAAQPQPVQAMPVQPQPVQATQPATAQTAMIAPVQRSDGNWLIGQWQGPSLGCPRDGGIEFTTTENLSWFDGEVAVRMRATYQIEGNLIRVTSTASDGSTQVYAYRREDDSRMVIAGVPDSMPQSMVGIAYRRCGAAPGQDASPESAGIIEVPANGEIPAPAAQPAAVQDVAAAPVMAPVAVPAGATAADGWAAFERGEPQTALAIFTQLAEGGDAAMQVLVGQIHDFGQGVPQNDTEALKWYLRAAEAGNEKARYQAGLLYFRSPNVPQNLVESYRWLSLVADGGGAMAIPARSMLNDLDRQMPEADIAKAKQLLKSPTN